MDKANSTMGSREDQRVNNSGLPHPQGEEKFVFKKLFSDEILFCSFRLFQQFRRNNLV